MGSDRQEAAQGWAARRTKKNRSKRVITGPSNGAVIYARVSSKEQEEGFSIGAQLDLLRRYATERGFEIVHEFVDVETARKAGRTHFGEMVRFIRSSLTPVTILVEKTDRIYRNLKDYTTLDELVCERDARIHLVKENEVLGREASSHTKFIHGIKVLMAKNYVDNLSEEVTKGQMKKAESGQYPSIPPMGYRWDRGKRSLIHVEQEAAHVRRAFERYATGLYSLEKVAQLCGEDGFASRKGSRISKHGIEGIIK
ncbi:MAG: recombinase family protein, partial [Chrysiogenetes bacterium]|nr:recombinase family protein [Chrysiogenetes bacterium]